MLRKPVVAGQFYPGNHDKLKAMVSHFLKESEPEKAEHALLAMAPHAGYIFSGPLAAQTIKKALLPRILVLLGPNHTGRGQKLAVWNKGAWEASGYKLQVEEELAAAILKAVPAMAEDYNAHAFEHSLEVMIPLLAETEPDTTIVPICVAESSLDILEQAGTALGGLLKDWKEPVGILVSSDMSHYIPHDDAKARDALALEQAVALDPGKLFDTVRSQGISMCGVLPMTLGLFAANKMGATSAELVGYTTSGERTGDYDQVVGYAGVIVR